MNKERKYLTGEESATDGSNLPKLDIPSPIGLPAVISRAPYLNLFGKYDSTLSQREDLNIKLKTKKPEYSVIRVATVDGKTINQFTTAQRKVLHALQHALWVQEDGGKTIIEKAKYDKGEKDTTIAENKELATLCTDTVEAPNSEWNKHLRGYNLAKLPEAWQRLMVELDVNQENSKVIMPTSNFLEQYLGYTKASAKNNKGWLYNVLDELRAGRFAICQKTAKGNNKFGIFDDILTYKVVQQGQNDILIIKISKLFSDNFCNNYMQLPSTDGEIMQAISNTLEMNIYYFLLFELSTNNRDSKGRRLSHNTPIKSRSAGHVTVIPIRTVTREDAYAYKILGEYSVVSYEGILDKFFTVSEIDKRGRNTLLLGKDEGKRSSGKSRHIQGILEALKTFNTFGFYLHPYELLTATGDITEDVNIAKYIRLYLNRKVYGGTVEEVEVVE